MNHSYKFIAQIDVDCGDKKCGKRHSNKCGDDQQLLRDHQHKPENDCSKQHQHFSDCSNKTAKKMAIAALTINSIIAIANFTGSI